MALVPTMGNLHAGHLALVDKAVQIADRTVVSIFVNPTQFVAGEDYDAYPRTLDADSLLLSGKGVDTVFLPGVEELYPNGTKDAIRVNVPALDNILCGEYRPGHFAGVATIVTKLFNVVNPHLALFGEKDYQQLLLVKRLVRELCLSIDIVSVPTVREVDGLAISSRNGYLTPEERCLAPRLYETLCKAANAAAQKDANLEAIADAGMEVLRSYGFRPEYFSFRQAADLAVPDQADDSILLAAAWLGKTRLIDNVAVHKPV